MTLAADWISLHLQRPGPLPCTVVPVHNETVESYLARLAQANHVTVDHLRESITGSTRKSDLVSAERLALISGQSERTLSHALPEVTVLHEPDRDQPSLGRLKLHQRPCELCTRARGHSGWIICWAHPHEAVCRRHSRWIGDLRSHQQFNIAGHPDILQANRLHRRLAHRLGADQTSRAFEEAKKVITKWHDQHRYEQDFLHHMAGFHGPHWRVNSTHPTIAAATYPQSVALTWLLASPYWQSASTVRPIPTEFVTEVRATIAPRYEWSPGLRYGVREPLIEAMHAIAAGQ